MWSWSVFDPGLRSLAGTHRVQRVPATEKRGRRHSSEVAVVVLDESGTASASGPPVRPGDVRVDTYRDTGPGGQHRNKTDSAVRITHLPSGIVITAPEDRSQHRNRKVAWERLHEALAQSRAVAAHAWENDVRADIIDSGRDWTWTGWRDEVKGPAGQRGVMSRVLAGKLGPLLR